MQSGERADQVFSHRVVTENGFEKIVPAELNPLMRGRVLTLREVQTIVATLAGKPLEEIVEVPKLFVPSAVAAPEHISEPATIDTDPGSAAIAAAQSTSALNEQFALAA